MDVSYLMALFTLCSRRLSCDSILDRPLSEGTAYVDRLTELGDKPVSLAALFQFWGVPSFFGLSAKYLLEKVAGEYVLLSLLGYGDYFL